jgi:phosphatidylserine/phosphatidylglycerophosphate/cardiolipin synthase-like enzyme
MAKFLNTTLLNEWIPKLIAASENELIIIVPYIKTSDRMYNYLYEANKRGVETTLVYRENKLLPNEKVKFESLDNLNLMYHPNIHCKCYYNESYLIITSMNLYEYSEKNNREMGILFEKKNNGFSDGERIFKDALEEIKEIINGAYLEKTSKETDTEGFIMEIIKNEKEKKEELCKEINKAFGHKKFEVEKKSDNNWYCVCHNYFDRINLTVSNRAELELKMDKERTEKIFNAFSMHYNEFMIQAFKIYWKRCDQPIMVYIDKGKIKEEFLLTKQEEFSLLKEGADKTIAFLRQLF